MLFSELAKQNRVTIDGQTMSGHEYCDEIINALCNTNVASEDSVAFAAMLRELKMPAHSLNRFFHFATGLFFIHSSIIVSDS